MSKSTDDTTKPRAKQTGTPVMVRIQPEQLNSLDNWRRQQDDLPNRPEAIRRLIAKAVNNNFDK